MSKVAKVEFVDYDRSVTKALDMISAAGKLPDKGLVIIKPNLTCSDGPPVTTNVGAAEAVYKYCKANSKAEVAIGEGCGTGTTEEVYRATGYTRLAKKYSIRLIDFNSCKTVLVKKKDALQLREFHIPEIVRRAFIISLPILKDHSFTQTTVAMKTCLVLRLRLFTAVRGTSRSFILRRRINRLSISVCIKSPICL
jgi:uncharacterized protein (DUF362 family)